MNWKDDIYCPVCDKISGYAESSHNPLSKQALQKARNDIKKSLRNVDTDTILVTVRKGGSKGRRKVRLVAF